MNNKWDKIYDEISGSSNSEIVDAIYFLEEKIIILETHIEQLLKLSQDYCMCGELLSSHYTSNHCPISEFDYYVKSNKLEEITPSGVYQPLKSDERLQEAIGLLQSIYTTMVLDISVDRGILSKYKTQIYDFLMEIENE